MFSYLKKGKEYLPPQHLFAALISGLCFSSILSLFLCGFDYTVISFADKVSLPLFCVLTLIVFLTLCATTVIMKSKIIIPFSAYLFILLFSFTLSVGETVNVFFSLGLCAVAVASGYFLCKYLKSSVFNISEKATFVVVLIIASVSTVIISAVCIARYNSFQSPTFDFGIFAQMFANIKKTGLPLTTVERNRLMSHFGVHFSPFLYLLCPFYMLVPRPQTILVLQAAAVSFGVIPVYLICKKLEISNIQTLLWCAVYSLYPAFTSAVVTDFHENKFISIILLFAVYFVLCKKKLPFFVFALLLLTVKEDCAIYVAVLALWLIISGMMRREGLILLLISISYFAFSCHMVAVLGDGVMTSRLSNYYSPEHSGSIIAAARNIVTNIGYFARQIFKEEKIPYVIYTLLPLLFLPFKQKKSSALILFLPLIIENLMLSWQYQYDVRYQYGYGSGAFLIVLALIALSESGGLKRRFFSLGAFTASVIVATGVNFARYKNTVINYTASSTEAAQTEECLEKIPKGSVIYSDTFIASHLYDYDKVYIVFPTYYEINEDPEYIVVDNRYKDKDYDAAMSFIEENGFTLAFTGGFADIYTK